MQRWLAILTMLGMAAVLQGQNFAPPAVAAYESPAAGVWDPLTTAASFGALNFDPPQVGLYCQTAVGQPWTPCVFGGGPGTLPDNLSVVASTSTGAAVQSSASQVASLLSATPQPLTVSTLTRAGTTATDSASLGAEITSGTGWTSTGWTGGYSTGFVHTTGNTDALSFPISTVGGQIYQVVFTISGSTAGSVTASLNGTPIFYQGTESPITGNVTVNEGPQQLPAAPNTLFLPAATTAGFVITPTSDFNGTISAISIKANNGGVGVRTNYLDSAGNIVSQNRYPLASLHDIFSGDASGVYVTSSHGSTFLGYQAGSPNSSGSENTFIGAHVGASNTTGSDNTFVGWYAGNLNVWGVQDTFVGQTSGQSNTTGNSNTFVGGQTGVNNTQASANTFVGESAGYSTWLAGHNTFVGNGAGFNTGASESSTGAYNTAIGDSAGYYNGDGSNNVWIGAGTGPGSTATALTNTIAIGSNVLVGTSNSTVIGNPSTATTLLYGAVTAYTSLTAPKIMVNGPNDNVAYVNIGSSQTSLSSGTGFTPNERFYPASGVYSLTTVAGAYTIDLCYGKDATTDDFIVTTCDNATPTEMFRAVSGGGIKSPTVTAISTVTAPTIVAGTATWTSGTTVPSSCSVTGSMFSNTSGAAGTTLYVCIAGAYVDVK